MVACRSIERVIEPMGYPSTKPVLCEPDEVLSVTNDTKL